MVIFPAIVTLPDGSMWTHAKVNALGQWCDVWVWNVDLGRPVPLVEADARPEPARRNVWTLAGPEGEVRIVRDPADCACSDPMKKFRPPRPIRNGVSV